MTMKCCPSCSSIAKTVQMLGWFSADAARASRWKRSSEEPSLRELGRQELQRDVAAEAGVLRLVDDAHPAAPETADDGVVGDTFPDEGIRRAGHDRQRVPQADGVPSGSRPDLSARSCARLPWKSRYCRKTSYPVVVAATQSAPAAKPAPTSEAQWTPR